MKFKIEDIILDKEDYAEEMIKIISIIENIYFLKNLENNNTFFEEIKKVDEFFVLKPKEKIKGYTIKDWCFPDREPKIVEQYKFLEQNLNYKTYEEAEKKLQEIKSKLNK